MLLHKFLAMLFLIVASVGVTLGNFWFTYGIWPQSWVSFVFFGLASLVIMVLASVVSKDL